MQHYDLSIIGGGIVGLAVAYRFQERFPNRSVVVLEKEAALAQHQTGHNSGVLHSGIYYQPASLKAINCREGKRAMEAFCEQEGIDYEICGKVIVAVDEQQLPALDRIFQRGQANQVRCEMIDRARLLELEPYAAGIRAIHVPEAGIVDYSQVCTRLAEKVRLQGGKFELGVRVVDFVRDDSAIICRTTRGEYRAAHVVNCAGLYSDRVAKLSGLPSPAKIVPFRGEYYQLRPEMQGLVKNLIYPVPDPSFPFLGVHFTRRIGGGIECGPNAVLALAREGYTKTKINPLDLAEVLAYPGFLKLAAKYWRVGLGEIWRSVNKRAFVRALQTLLPDIRAAHLEWAPAGVRAQAVSSDGNMVDDFLIEEVERVVNVVNAPSPAATSSLNIGHLVVQCLQDRFS
ncbi:MAG: L-2-hydroxyglutarate oxidase [Pirellulales bacterium]|nr:L-2-hydroxyglutarate oxidase [Pirellulales bacterium]